MLRQKCSTFTRVCLMILSVLMLVGVYSYLSHKQHQINPDDTTVPTWAQMYDGLMYSVRIQEEEGEFQGRSMILEDLKASGLRLFLGFAVGVFGAMFLGFLMGSFWLIESSFEIPIALGQKLPVTAALAIFLVTFGKGLGMYTAMIAFSVLPILTASIVLAVKDIPDELVYKAYTIGASNLEVISSVFFRIALPKVWDNILLMLGPAIIALIAAEMIVGSEGIGVRIRIFMRRGMMDIVNPYLAVTLISFYLVEYVTKGFRWLTCQWYISKNNGGH